MKPLPCPPDIRSTFLEAMSRVASTVSIVTTDGPAGRAGATASSLVSVSAETEKPTVLICLRRDGRTAQAIMKNEGMCINVLGEDQEAIAGIFASPISDIHEQKFTGLGWTIGSTGAPRLASTAVALECRVVQSTCVGLHYVFFGEVEDVVIGRDVSPLLYARRTYWTPADAELFAA